MSSYRGITIGCSTARSPDFIARYKKHILRTVGLQRVEFFFCYNPGTSPLATVYNHILKQANYPVICLIHDDLIFPRNRKWGRYVLQKFKSHPEFSILGVAGSLSLESHCVPWSNYAALVGRLWHRLPSGQRILTEFSENMKDEIIEVLCLDGLFLAIHRERLSVRFDERLSGFHFYDVQLTLDHWLGQKNRLKQQKNGVLTNLGLTHCSTGKFNQAYEESRRQMEYRYRKSLPACIKSSIKRPLQVGGHFCPKLKTALLFFHLCPDVPWKLCFENLPPPPHPDSRLIIASTVRDKFPSDYSGWPVSVYPKRLSVWHLNQALHEVLNYYQLTAFEVLVVWDSRILTDSRALYRLLNVFQTSYLPVGSVGLRLHYEDESVFFSGLDIFKVSSGQMDVRHHGIHSLYQHYIDKKPTPYNYLGYCLLSTRLVHLVADMSGGQNWVPGLEWQLSALKFGFYHYIAADSVGIYRESVFEQTESPELQQQKYMQFQKYLSAWFQWHAQDPSIQFWTRMR